jgi:hypothetical protein
MLVQICYFAALVLTALLMGTSYAHALEMPQKLRVEGPLWLTFQHTLYPYFAYVGAPVELGSIGAAAFLAYLVRAQRPAFFLALTAVVCLAIAFFVVWLGFTNPVNSQTARWTAASMPADWTSWRRQWEYSHLARFALHLIAFGALVAALLRRSE